MEIKEQVQSYYFETIRAIPISTIEFFCPRHYLVIGCPRKFDVHNKYGLYEV